MVVKKSEYFQLIRRIKKMFSQTLQNMKKIILNNNHIKDNRGFSLIELLIVMVILGLLASLVGPKMFGKLGKAKQGTAKAQIEMLGAALDAYRLDMGAYPPVGLGSLVENHSGSEKWDGPYLTKKKIPEDPWGEEYIYTFPGEHGEYDLYSYGADRQPGGEGENADIVSWE